MNIFQNIFHFFLWKYYSGKLFGHKIVKVWTFGIRKTPKRCFHNFHSQKFKNNSNRYSCANTTPISKCHFQLFSRFHIFYVQTPTYCVWIIFSCQLNCIVKMIWLSLIMPLITSYLSWSRPPLLISTLLFPTLWCCSTIAVMTDVFTKRAKLFFLSQLPVSYKSWLSDSQLVAVRTIPWAKANLNYTAQALIISAGMTLTYVHIFYWLVLQLLIVWGVSDFMIRLIYR